MDNTKGIISSYRIFDSMAYLMNGNNVCTALTFWMALGKFIASNNTGCSELITKYMSYWRSFIANQKSDTEEEEKLINESYIKERAAYTMVIGLTKNINNLALLKDNPKMYYIEEKNAQIKELKDKKSKWEAKLPAKEEQRDLELKKLKEIKAQLISSRLSLVSERVEIKAVQVQEMDQIVEPAEKNNKEQRLQEIETEVRRIMVDQREIDKKINFAGGTVKKLKDDIRKKEEDIRSIEDKFNKLEEFTEAYVTDTEEDIKKEIIKLKNKLEEQKSDQFKKKLQCKLKKINQWILDLQKKYKANNDNNSYEAKILKMEVEFVFLANAHAEMNVIDEIYRLNKKNDNFPPFQYVGISRLCCGRCINVIAQINRTPLIELINCSIGNSQNNSKKVILTKDSKKPFNYLTDSILVRGTHLKPYEIWVPPQLCKDLKLDSLETALDKIGRDTKKLWTATRRFSEEALTSESEPESKSEQEFDENIE